MAPARTPDRRRPLAWATAVVLVALSVLHVVAAALGDPLHDPVALVWGALGIAGLLAAARYVTAQCFESRLGILFVGASTLVAVVLLHLLGAPGSMRPEWSLRDLLLLALSAALLASWRVTARHRAER
jgi:hypothetical protein